MESTGGRPAGKTLAQTTEVHYAEILEDQGINVDFCVTELAFY